MRLRMYCAFAGICNFSASSTERTLAMACTVVHTPQKRWVNSQASRGSRPSRIFSMPRHMVHDAHALEMAPLSTSTSTRKWPSIRVIGSIVMRFVIIHTQSFLICTNRELVSRRVLAFRQLAGEYFDLACRTFFDLVPQAQWSRQDGQSLHGKDESRDRQRHGSHRNQQLDRCREIESTGSWLEGQRGGIEAIQHASDGGDQMRVEHQPRISLASGVPKHEYGHAEKKSFHPEQSAIHIQMKCQPKVSAEEQVGEAKCQPPADQASGDAVHFTEHVEIHGPLPHQ